ncbi:MAG: 5-(carboxyamino)imidazole ribonucleotide synthase [Cetobacterium sp.]|uniref:5-(carboxyamino)imidazole ribonucleotide synthase n=1 Tax=Cetobacterium sp. TaxID=2071632 RepID=UPI002FC72B36
MNKSKTIGILGGGQLAKMLCDSAKKMGYTSVILDPSSDACGKFSSNLHLIKDYTDEKSLKEISEISGVVTYEFENVPIESIEIIEKIGGNIPQGKTPLYLSQHRIREKNAVRNLGVKTAKYKQVSNIEELKEALKEVGIPAILKTCSGGYDGKGQWKIKNESDLNNIKLESREYILEEMVNFEKEVSCLVVRGINGEVVNFPIGENIHKNGILNLTIVPAQISKELEEKIIENSKKIIEKLGVVGPLGIEFFIAGEEIYFNEMAPRPHNSAHYTMDACNYSQFDIHLMAILGEKIPRIKLLKNIVMLNILGEDKEKLEKIQKSKKGIVHIYGKNSWEIGRKMGHVNFCGNDIDELIELAKSF